MACGLVGPWPPLAQLIPPKPIRELGEMTRYRNQLVYERTKYANRLQKVLESANIKLGAVASDILGVSGRVMLEALIAGEQDAAQMAEYARGRTRQRLPDLRQAVRVSQMMGNTTLRGDAALLLYPVLTRAAAATEPVGTNGHDGAFIESVGRARHR